MTEPAARTDSDSTGLAGAARGTREGVVELRDFIRAQPITAALLLLGLGYLAGRVAGASHAAARR